MTSKIIILAAGQGTRLRPLTDSIPKCMVRLHDRALLEWNMLAARAAGIAEAVTLGGYAAEELRPVFGSTILNPDYATTNMVMTLLCARDEFAEGFIMAYGDIVYNPEVMSALLADDSDIAVVVDRKWRTYWEDRSEDPLADAESLKIAENGCITSIGQKESSLNDIEAQYIGLVAFRRSGVSRMLELIDKEKKFNAQGENYICKKRNLNSLYMTDLLQGLINEGQKVKSVEVDGGWFEVDCPEDLEYAIKHSSVENGQLKILR